MRVWLKIDPWLDWLVPTLLVFAIALLVRKALEALTSH